MPGCQRDARMPERCQDVRGPQLHLEQSSENNRHIFANLCKRNWKSLRESMHMYYSIWWIWNNSNNDTQKSYFLFEGLQRDSHYLMSSGFCSQSFSRAQWDPQFFPLSIGAHSYFNTCATYLKDGKWRGWFEIPLHLSRSCESHVDSYIYKYKHSFSKNGSLTTYHTYY